MADEGYNPTVPVAPEDGSAQATNDPVDLSEAFKLLRQNQQEAAQPAEQSTDAQQGTEVAGAATPSAGEQYGSDNRTMFGTQESTPTVDAGVPSSTPYTAGGEDVGGSSTDSERIDYDAQAKGLAQRLQIEARNEVLKNFSDKNIKKMTIGDIYERRDDGSIVFNNPDDPRRPFANRSEAQQWIDSMNAQIDDEYLRQVREAYSRKLKDARPQFSMYQIGPYYDMMNQTQRDIFDDLIEPYAIIRNGQAVGFNCDLVAAARQAIAIAKRFEQQQPKQQQPVSAVQSKQPVAPTTPAMDMKTGNGESLDDKEPTTIQEAWAKMNRMKKENR